MKIGHVFGWKHVPPGQGNFKNDPPPLGSDRYDPKFTVKTVNHPSQVMAWGLLAGKGVVGDCTSFLLMWPWGGGGLIMWMFWGILCSHFLTCIPVIFLCMMGHLLRELSLLREVLASHNIPVLDWPGNSPDFNPIENALQIMKNKIHVQAPTSVKELQELLKRTWAEMDPA